MAKSTPLTLRLRISPHESNTAVIIEILLGSADQGELQRHSDEGRTCGFRMTLRTWTTVVSLDLRTLKDGDVRCDTDMVGIERESTRDWHKRSVRMLCMDIFARRRKGVMDWPSERTAMLITHTGEDAIY